MAQRTPAWWIKNAGAASLLAAVAVTAGIALPNDGVADDEFIEFTNRLFLPLTAADEADL